MFLLWSFRLILGNFVVGLKDRKSFVRIVDLIFQNLQLWGYRLYYVYVELDV